MRERRLVSGLLSGLGLVLIGIHLTILWRIPFPGQFGLSVVVWTGIIYLYRKRWPTVGWEGSLPGFLVGISLLGLALVNGFWIGPHSHGFSHVYPLLAGTGYLLMAHGFRGVGRCWREVLLLFCMGGPRWLLGQVDILPVITARLAALTMWYLGWDFELHGRTIVMAGGSVVVDQGCAGPGVISYLICMALFGVLLFRMSKRRRVLALLAAPVLAFLTNIARVMVLALLEGTGRHEAFEMWHSGYLSQLWNAAPVMMFGVLLLSMAEPSRRSDGESGQPK